MKHVSTPMMESKEKIQRVVNNPLFVPQLKQLYQNTQLRGEVVAFAKRWGIPRHQVRRKALELGVVQSYKKEPDWSDEEIDILEQHYSKRTDNIRQILLRRGFSRTETSISVKRKRLNLFVSEFDGENYTANSLAIVMGVDPKTITRWIELKYISAKKRPGSDDRWLIKHAAVKSFVVENAALVDLRKVDKFWFIELLAGRYSA